MDMIIEQLKKEIKKHDRPENRINYQQFFKEKLKEPTGLKTPVLRKISNRFYRDIKGLSKGEILKICDQLLESSMRYGRFFAFEWAIKLKKQYGRDDFKRFERWLKKYVDNWGSCDHICGGPIGNMVLQFPELVKEINRWTASKNRWLRRAAAVSLIVPVRRRLLLDEVFKIADILLMDTDDMVQKGYGWMLKEASNEFPAEVFGYVMKHKAVMPRTALRYAIEKLPSGQKKEAMKK